MLKQILEKGKGPEAMRRMVVLNVAVALQLLCPDETLEQCVAQGTDSVAQGVGRRCFMLERIKLAKADEFWPWKFSNPSAVCRPLIWVPVQVLRMRCVPTVTSR